MPVERNRAPGQELSEAAGKLHAYQARGAAVKEFDARKQFKAFDPFKEGCISKAAVSARWAPTWEMADGAKCVMTRVAAKGYEDPVLRDGSVDSAGRVSLCSSERSRLFSLGAFAKWKVRSLDVKYASTRAGGLGRHVFLREPTVWGLSNVRRIRELGAPA